MHGHEHEARTAEIPSVARERETDAHPLKRERARCPRVRCGVPPVGYFLSRERSGYRQFIHEERKLGWTVTNVHEPGSLLLVLLCASCGGARASRKCAGASQRVC